jgi:mRNA interferase RelE/StbE
MYSVEFTKEAAKQIRLLPRKIRRQVSDKIALLERDPFPSGSKQLQPKDRLSRLRSGAYRIIYQVDGRRLLILVLKIGNRKEIYRKNY